MSANPLAAITRERTQLRATLGKLTVKERALNQGLRQIQQDRAAAENRLRKIDAALRSVEERAWAESHKGVVFGAQSLGDNSFGGRAVTGIVLVHAAKAGLIERVGGNSWRSIVGMVPSSRAV